MQPLSSIKYLPQQQCAFMWKVNLLKIGASTIIIDIFSIHNNCKRVGEDERDV